MKTSALFVWPLLGVLGLWATLLPAALGASPADELPPVVAGSAWGSGTTRLAPALLASIAETKVRQAARTAYLSAEGLAYGATVSAAVQKIGVEFAGDTVGLRVGMEVNLMKKSFGGASDFTVVGRFDTVNAIHTWSFKRIKNV